MSIDGTLRPLKQYDTSGDGLKRGVGQLEANVAAAISRIATQALPKLEPTDLQTRAYVAKLDDLVVTNGTFPVSLPVATATNAGRQIGVLVKGGTVTVTSQSGVQGGASDVLATVGLRRYESTGVDWWRSP